MEHGDNLLTIRNLHTYFYTEDGIVKALNGVNLDIRHGECLGLVGESGSGKSVTALSILRLIQEPPGKSVEGQIVFEGEDLLTLSTERMCEDGRGGKIAMIFQDPMTSLNPVFRVGTQVGEAIKIHQHVGWKEALRRAIEMMVRVGIPSDTRATDYPHQFSGGMKQRVMISMGLSGNPRLLIADEPTTALDVTIQAQIINLLQRIQSEYDLTFLFISPDLGVVLHLSNRVVVMYLGRLAELAETEALFAAPKHPYTQALLSAVPSVKQRKSKNRMILTGDVPTPFNPPQGWRFHTRCPMVMDKCQEIEPRLQDTGNGHFVACHLFES